MLLPQRQLVRPASRTGCVRRARTNVCALPKNPFEGLFGGAGKSSGGDADAARRAIERSLGKKQGPGQKQGQPSSGGSSSSGPFSSRSDASAAGGGGRSARGGGWSWGSGGNGGGSSAGGGASGSGDGPERPMLAELADLFRGMASIATGAALFLLVADVLHRSLDWCCQVELLLLVGAPAQALERLAAAFYSAVEWLEANALGWRLPTSAAGASMPMYRALALYYPQEHAYAFDAYRHAGAMRRADAAALQRFYALRWWERDGGFAGDVTAAEVADVKARVDPGRADVALWRAAAASGEAALQKYWAAHAGELQSLTGDKAPPL